MEMARYKFSIIDYYTYLSEYSTCLSAFRRNKNDAHFRNDLRSKHTRGHVVAQFSSCDLPVLVKNVLFRGQNFLLYLVLVLQVANCPCNVRCKVLGGFINSRSYRGRNKYLSIRE